MKNLNEWLSTKVVKPISGKFPDIRDLDEIIKFLEDHGYKRLVYDGKDRYISIINKFIYSKSKDKTGKFYMYGCSKSNPGKGWIRFIDEGSIQNNDHHMFCVFYNSNIENDSKRSIAGFTEDCTYLNSGRKYFENYDELIDKINDSIVW